MPAGLYHYDPFAHALEPIAGFDVRCQALLSAMTGGAQLADAPLVIAMASRFQRRSWKYAGIAYANGLKGAGVLQETMMLVASDMGWPARAVAADDDVGFAAVTGLDREIEGLVGGMVLAWGSEPTA